MDITDNLIDKLSHLSKLNFSGHEKEEIKKDLANMIQFIEQLQHINTTNIQPLLHMGNTVNMLREDFMNPQPINRENALKNAPSTDGTYFKVPKVIKK